MEMARFGRLEFTPRPRRATLAAGDGSLYLRLAFAGDRCDLVASRSRLPPGPRERHPGGDFRALCRGVAAGRHPAGLLDALAESARHPAVVRLVAGLTDLAAGGSGAVPPAEWADALGEWPGVRLPIVRSRDARMHFLGGDFSARPPSAQALALGLAGQSDASQLGWCLWPDNLDAIEQQFYAMRMGVVRRQLDPTSLVDEYGPGPMPWVEMHAPGFFRLPD